MKTRFGIGLIFIGLLFAQPTLAGSKSNKWYEMEFSDNTETSAPGELVTYSVKIKNIYSENTVLTPQLSVTAKGLEVPFVSDNGKRGSLSNGKSGATADWNSKTSQNQKIRNEVKLNTKKSHTFTFQVKTPTSLGSEYCIQAYLFSFLQDKDCNTVVKSTGKKIIATPTPKPIPAEIVKITEKDFRIISPDTLRTDYDDQEITWYSTSVLQKKYSNVKIELCPGKDFKNCIILDAVTENDGSHIINMPPIPRVGKWYLHIIGRNSSDGLVPSVTASKRIELHQ